MSVGDRAAFGVDLHDLGRGPGRSLSVELSAEVPAEAPAEVPAEALAEAPAGWGNAIIGVAPGSTIAVDLTLESVIEGVLVTGSAVAQVVGNCGRCLDPVERRITVRFDELFRYPDLVADRSAERPGDADDDELPILSGEILDLESTVRDAIVLALPLSPRCREDCPGLCPECGVKLADHQGHRHDRIDPRWAELTRVFDEPERPAGSQ